MPQIRRTFIDSRIFKHRLFLSRNNNVNLKLHSKRMNRFARSDPQPFPGLQRGVLQQPGAALRTGIGDTGTVSQFDVPRLALTGYG